MGSSIRRSIALSCVLVMAINVSACGYFLYPERKGQTGGRVDPAVVILDGAALLFGILPGVVAFAVDFTNGTIYLPPGSPSVIDRHTSAVDTDRVRKVTDENGRAWLQLSIDGKSDGSGDLAGLEVILTHITGLEVDADDIVWLQDATALRAAISTQVTAR
ncbi:hypothetical protein [Microbulbifer sp. 2205BS26-8]|uniref:hypothetical protein n=1 Tax=Microbulbifer sp. 2205BS26-8 TaxID=3064386 RepID=UPI00273F68A6|nr:hypothetical protein [Microbulbifer sp. 2205BS26-8]MDP5209092.1 hypothetical protein [Microbulbifer sp. 2205BS26-8]